MSLFFNTLQNDVFRRYWTPQSEEYGRADVLLSYVQSGWQILDPIRAKQVMLRDGECVEVYVFRLSRRNELIQMPVLASPLITHLLAAYRIEE